MVEAGRALSEMNWRALSMDRDPTAIKVALGEREMARETFRAISAQPRIPKRTGVVALDMALIEWWGVCRLEWRRRLEKRLEFL